MARCAKCVREGGQCPGCGRDTDATRREVNKKLQKYFFPSLPGLLGVLAGTRYYPLLESERLAAWGLCLMFLPVVPHNIISGRRRLAANAEQLEKLYLGCGSVLVLNALGTFANRALDNFPVRTVSTVVARKSWDGSVW
jgi:hypothetical protein